MPLADLRRGANTRGTMPTYGGTTQANQQAGLGQALQNRGMGAAYDSLGMARQGAMGQGPSLAAAQLQAGRQQGLVDQMGMASMAQGGSMASQQRQAMGMGTANQMGMARDAAMARMQEQQAAQAAYAQQAQNLAGMGMQANQFGQGLLQNAANTVYQGQMGWEMGQRGMDQAALEARRRFGMGLGQGIAGGLGQVGSAAMMFSDERVKDIDPNDAGKEAVKAVAGLRSIKYRYRSQEHGPTDRDIVGFRAQDLERSGAGKQLVTDTPRGKMVDVGGVASLALSAVAELARDVEQVKRRGLAGARRVA